MPTAPRLGPGAPRPLEQIGQCIAEVSDQVAYWAVASAAVTKVSLRADVLQLPGPTCSADRAEITDSRRGSSHYLPAHWAADPS